MEKYSPNKDAEFINKYNPQQIEKKWPSSAKATEGKLKYDPQAIEKKWQDKWEQEGLYQAKEDPKKEKFYCLDMFPYPSGEGLHVGHWRGYVLSDVVARYQKLKGKTVLHPMGWDAFGLPAENAAIKNNSQPSVFTKTAIKRFTKQLKQIGAMFDWSREINTSEPEYYEWTQWLFLQLYKNNLAYRKKAPVNWCPSCQTVLANEQVVAGECERCGSQVIQKNLTQWFFKITDFSDDLLKDLEDLDWPERTKTLQKNWIGKSKGTLVKFKIQNSKIYIEVFTTRADTLFGCTYLVLSPENPVIKNLQSSISNFQKVEEYVESSKKKSNSEHQELQKDKTGVRLEGIKAINPINNEEVEIWIADYVLSSYGTGAVMAVPAHDQRDFEFAKKYSLPIKQVISKNGASKELKEAFVEYATMINSKEFDGLSSQEGQNKITQKLKEKNLGDFSTNYRLRDWLISRQRYWGAPIPIIYCHRCGEVPVPEENLPVELPKDVDFNPKGDSPLKQSKEFLSVKCPKCGGQAKRETDTMDTFVCSSWYYLRYTDPKNSQEIAGCEKVKYWMPVDFYVGGIEHAVLHLLYARFISKALHKLGLIDFSSNGEPFKKLFNIGMVYLHGAKMSKSKGNVVSPDELIKKYGTDALRGYELFIGPANQDSEWQASGIIGIYRFLEKVWIFFGQDFSEKDTEDSVIEKTIQIVTREIEQVKPNTAISHLMELFNYLKDKKISAGYAKKIVILLSPFFPHIAEEIWQKLGEKESIFNQTWPKIDKNQISNKTVFTIQISGKFKDKIEAEKDIAQDELESKVKNLEKIKLALKDKKISKTIFIHGRTINFVVE